MIIAGTGNVEMVTIEVMRRFKDMVIVGNIGGFDNKIDPPLSLFSSEAGCSDRNGTGCPDRNRVLTSINRSWMAGP